MGHFELLQHPCANNCFCHNYMTKGEKWREFGVTKDKVLIRCQGIKNGSAKLNKFICNLIDDAVDKGYLSAE